MQIRCSGLVCLGSQPWWAQTPIDWFNRRAVARGDPDRGPGNGLPFATLILLTAAAVAGRGKQKEAAEMDGASALSTFIYLHAAASGAGRSPWFILIETIFPLDRVRRDLCHHRRRPGLCRPPIFAFPDLTPRALIQYDVPATPRPAGWVAVVIANIVAFFLVRNRRAEIWRRKAMARKVTDRSVWISTAAAWFFRIPDLPFPILLDGSDELPRPSSRRSPMPPKFLLFSLDHRELRDGSGAQRTISSRRSTRSLVPGGSNADRR